MDINIFTKYEVNYECKYSYINEDGDFSDGKAKWTKILFCSEFVDLLYKFCNDYDFIRMLIKDNHIDIEHFNSNTGETSDIKITYKEIDNKDEK